MAGREKRDIPEVQGQYTVTNFTDDRALDVEDFALALSGTDSVAAVLGTLIQDLIEQGIITGAVTA